MSYALVGSIGAVAKPAVNAAAAPAWGAGETRVAGHLLVCWVTGMKSASGSAGAAYGAPATPSGWTRAIMGDDGGAQPVGAIFYKIATGGDAAPTFAAGGTGQSWVAQLAEFSGNTAAPLDQTAASPNLGTTATGWTVTCPGTDATVPALVVTLVSVPCSATGGNGIVSESVNNGVTLTTANINGTLANNFFEFGYGTTTSNAVATADTAGFTAGVFTATGVMSLIVTFKVASGPVAMAPTATCVAKATALVTTGTLAFVGDAQAAAATVNLPSGWQPGDIAVAYAYRNGSNAPPTVPSGWTSITATTGANTNSRAIGWRSLQAGDTSTGTWTNATDIAVTILRGQASVPIGAFASGGANTTTLTMPALTLTKTDGTSWLLLFAGSKASNANTVTYPNTADEGSTDGSLNCSFDPNATAFAGGTFSAVVDTSGNRTDVIEVPRRSACNNRALADRAPGSPQSRPNPRAPPVTRQF